ncbi:hypothetical protein KY336_01145 [Candidatus Woesearchaeota archaeon]|nr:hypothetical protein [Candidatus Woesearchaeota archaeon]
MKLLAILTIIFLLAVTFAAADEFSDCPGPKRTVRGTVWLTEGDSWSMLRPLSGITVTVESKCGFSYENVVSDIDGEFSIDVQGPITLDIKKGQQYFGYGNYLHNKNNDVDMRVQEGREVFVNVLNPRYKNYPRSKNILECEDGEVHHFWHPQIYLTRSMGDCVLTAHDGVKAFQGDISLDTAGANFDVKLDKKADEIRMPKLIAKPSETVFRINKGWNLIPYGMIGNGRTTCFYNDEKPFSFFYEPLTKTFKQGRVEEFYEALYEKEAEWMEENKDMIIMNFGLGTMWFASPVDCEILFEMPEIPAEIEHKLFKGWNFRYVEERLVGSTLEEVGRSCEIEKAYRFDSENQQWEKIGSREPLDEYAMGFIVKVADDCTLTAFNQGFIPPALPE